MAVAGTGLALAGPALALAALAVKLTDGGPVLYRQTRVGKDGEDFELLKLRTMVVGAEAIRNGTLALPTPEEVERSKAPKVPIGPLDGLAAELKRSRRRRHA